VRNKKRASNHTQKLREKCGITNKVLIVDDKEKGILLKPLPSPYDEIGSLKGAFPGKNAKDLIEEGRRADYERDKRLLRLAGKPDV